MTRLSRVRGSKDDGAVLLLALAFLLLFGLFIVALLGQTSTSLKTTAVVRVNTTKTYNADAGLDYGLMRVRQDQTLCPSAAAGAVSITSEVPGGLIVNPGSQPVEVTCRTIDGASVGANGYAAIVLSPDSDALETKDGLSKTVEGPIFVRGGLKLGKELNVKGGDADNAAAGCVRPAKLTVTAPYGYVCPMATPTLPAHLLPPYPTIPRTRNGTLLPGGCTVFQPGVYAQAPALGTKNYFTSGVYVLRDIGRWDIGKADLYGGEQASGENVQVTTGAPCTTDSAAGVSPNGTGVQLILEGSSRLNLENQSRMELFNRVPAGAAEGTPGVSVYAVGPDAPATWKPWASVDPVVGLKNGTTPEAAFHGLVYAPTAKVELFATNTTVAQSLAGVVADKLLLESSASAGALSISASRGQGKRVLLLTATAPGSSPGEVAVTSTAVVEITNDAAHSLRVLSRRIS